MIFDVASNSNKARQSNAVRAVAKYCAFPKLIHWRTALGILGYVKRTSSPGITFYRGGVAGLSFQVFSDADYASKATGRRSVSGGLIMCEVDVYQGFRERRSV